MASVEVEVWDITGNRREVADLPDDEPVNRILVRLAELMELPTRHPDDTLIVYKFHHATAGQIRDEQTLSAAGVRQGDILRIYAEITAGGWMP